MKAHYDPLTEYMLIHANPHFHHPLTYYERCQIDVLWNQAHLHNMAEIARILHRPEWTINREIRRVQHFQAYHSTKQRKLPKRFRNYHYDASLAQKLADQRKESKTLPRADKYTVKQLEQAAQRGGGVTIPGFQEKCGPLSGLEWSQVWVMVGLDDLTGLSNLNESVIL